MSHEWSLTPGPPQFLTPLRACEDRAVTLVVMRRTHREQTAMVGKCSEPKQRSFVLERRNAIADHLRRLPRHSGPNRRIQWINMPGLTMKVADHVRWYLMATSNFELHAPHWHGNTVVIQHMRTDVATLLTMGMLVADMVPDNPGTWLFHCHVAPHLRGGMQALYTVEAKAPSKQTSGR